MKSILKTLYKKRIYFYRFRAYVRLYERIISMNPEFANKMEGEDKWLKKWRKYDKRLSPLCYRIFSHYVPQDIEIIPLELVSAIVEPVLTPLKYNAYYKDKNNFNKLLPNYFMPKVLFRNIDGLIYDENYELLDDYQADALLKSLSQQYDKVIVKPSRGDSGAGVEIMYRNKNGVLANKRDEELSLNVLRRDYTVNYLIQECIIQSEYMSQFNPSSVNTIRMAAYKDEKGMIHCLNAILRIGAKGANVDNTHAGGVFCGLSQDGKLGDWVCNSLGQRQNIYNGFLFENNDYIIPNYDKVRELVVEASRYLLHHDLIAYDIALDTENNPKLVEFNIEGFSSWFFLMSGNSVFRGLDEKVMARCYKMYSQLEYQLL